MLLKVVSVCTSEGPRSSSEGNLALKTLKNRCYLEARGRGVLISGVRLVLFVARVQILSFCLTPQDSAAVQLYLTRGKLRCHSNDQDRRCFLSGAMLHEVEPMS